LVLAADRLRVRDLDDVAAPLFPSLLRSSGAGFCSNIGRLAAAVGAWWLPEKESDV
jgi:hypothetical protein